MSLYDDIDITESVVKDKKADLAGWGSSIKMLQVQQQLQAKNKASLNQPRKRGGATLAPVINLKRNSEEFPLTFNHQTGKLERMELSTTVGTGSIFLANEPVMVGLLGGIPDEYDPFRPNEYEDFVKRRREQRKREKREEQRKEEEERRNRNRFEDEEIFESRRRDDSDEDEEREKEKEKRRSIQGVAIAPPTSLLEDSGPKDNSNSNTPPPNEDIDGMEMDDMSPPRLGFGTPGGLKLGGPLGNSVASKIMAKYGYREGQGLGKKEQGMSTCLQVEKTSKRGGKIIHERDIPKTIDLPPPPRAPPTNSEIMKNPSKVVILRNMVGPGGVDEDLEPETAEECTKYGKVIKCLIFEIPEAIPEEAVRIFVEFERLESAIKAIVDLNGRFFGGRMVKACFYNLDKFRRLDLTEELPI